MVVVVGWVSAVAHLWPEDNLWMLVDSFLLPRGPRTVVRLLGLVTSTFAH